MKLLIIVPIQRKDEGYGLVLVAEVESDEAEVVQISAAEEKNPLGLVEIWIIVEPMFSYPQLPPAPPKPYQFAHQVDYGFPLVGIEVIPLRGGV